MPCWDASSRSCLVASISVSSLSVDAVSGVVAFGTGEADDVGGAKGGSAGVAEGFAAGFTGAGRS